MKYTKRITTVILLFFSNTLTSCSFNNSTTVEPIIIQKETDNSQSNQCMGENQEQENTLVLSSIDQPTHEVEQTRLKAPSNQWKKGCYSANLDTSTAPCLDSQIFKAKGGHQIQFVDQACNEAIVNDNVAKPFSRILQLRVIKSNPELKIQDFQAYNTAWHQHHIHVCFPEKDPKGKGYICIEDKVGLQGGGGKTPLHMAAHKGDLELVKILIVAGADKEALDDEGLTPLHVAVLYGHLEIVRYLIDLGAQVETYHNLGANPLHSAASKGYLSIVQYLVEENKHISIDTRGKTLGCSPLHLAAAYNHPQVVAYLLGRGANKEACSNKQETSLHLAVTKGHTEVVFILVKAGADLHAIDETGLTPIEKASTANQFDLIKAIFPTVANINARGADGLTHLHRSIIHGDLPLVALLIELGADINTTDLHQHMTPLHIGVEKGYIELINQLISLGADLYAKNKAGLTPLHIGFQIKQIAWIKELLQHTNLLPLHWAIQAGELELAKQLLGIGVNINTPDLTGWTPLHWAAYNGNLSTVKWLVEVGHAPLFIVENQGKTPLDLAIQKNHIAVIGYLRELTENILAAQKGEIQKQLSHHFGVDLQQSLKELWEYVGVDADAMYPQELVNQFVDNTHSRIQGKNNDSSQELEVKEKEKGGEDEKEESIEEKVNALLRGIQEGLQAHAGAIPEGYREAWLNFPVENLRPQATRFVEEAENSKKEIENFKREQEKETEEAISQVQAETQELIKNMQTASQEAAMQRKEEDARWEQHQENYQLATSWIAVPCTENFFISSYRMSNMEDIKEYMEYIREELEEISDEDVVFEEQPIDYKQFGKESIEQKKSEEELANKKLSEAQQADIKNIFKQIEKEQKEIKPLYRAMKAYVEHRGGDILFIQQDINQFIEIRKEAFEKEHKILQDYYNKMFKEYGYNIEEVQLTGELLQDLEKAYGDSRSTDILLFQQPSRFCEFKKDAFKKECKIIQKNIEDVELARTCLEELQTIKEELYQILKDRNENLADYMENGHDSDFENDYSTGELMEYLASCGLTLARMRQQAFMHSFHKYITIKLLQFEKNVEDSVSINAKAWKSLFQQAYKFTNEKVAAVIDQDEAFIHTLKSNFNEAFVAIMQRLGEEATVTTAEFIELLQAIPGFNDYVGEYYASIPSIPFIISAFDRIPGLILQVIISSIPASMIERIIQLTCLNEIKKRVHKLQVAIQQIIVQQSKLIKMQID